MSVDVRTREDGSFRALDPDRFFAGELPAALEAHRAEIAPGAAGLGLRPLTIETPDAAAMIG